MKTALHQHSGEVRAGEASPVVFLEREAQHDEGVAHGIW